MEMLTTEKKGNDGYSFKNSEIFEIWLKQDTKCKNNTVLCYIVEQIGKENISDEFGDYITGKVYQLCKKLDEKWKNSHRRLDIFRVRYHVWLLAETSFEQQKTSKKFDKSQTDSKGKSSTVAGRPRINFSEKSERSKRREASELSISKQNETGLFVRAAALSARKSGELDLASVLTESIKSPTRPSKIRKLCTRNARTPVELSDEEALAFFLENNFSKKQYCNIRLESKERNSDIFPSYHKIIDSKRKCRPEGITVSETMAKVPLQMLLEHTAFRIIEMQKDVITTVMNAEKSSQISTELILSYGFDSSTGQAQFKQAFNEPNTSYNADSSLLATTVIPLRLSHSSGKILWNNRTPQSTRFCRPIKLEFVKETKEVISKEDADLKKQIEELSNLQIQLDEDKTVEINFKLFLTLIDGKVLNVLTGTKSNQVCPICGATPKDFVSVNNYKSDKFRPIEDNLKYGICPLHCWIRFFEFVLHIGYKIDVKTWQIRSVENKEAVKQKKEKIQNEFCAECGLRVDIPKVGGSGTSNDGNTARRAFSDHKAFSKTTGVGEELIFRLKTILICLTCQFPLNLEKFELYTFETAEYIKKKYPWVVMTPTVHKVLIHSSQIMQNTMLPVGCFGEDAAESRHKVYKCDRVNHARKNSRTNNLHDVFCRAMDTSDPLISSFRLNTRIH